MTEEEQEIWFQRLNAIMNSVKNDGPELMEPIAGLAAP